MTNRDLFEAIGHVDDDLILAADAPVQKRRKPPVYLRGAVSAAACLCLLVGGITAVTRHSDADKSAVMLTADAPETAAALQADTAESAVALGLARCVQIDGVRYYESAAIADTVPDREADGVITADVPGSEFPETDGCSNFGVGYSYWILDGDRVVVDIDGLYTVFDKTETAQ